MITNDQNIVKYADTFYGRHTALTPAVAKMYKF